MNSTEIQFSQALALIFDIDGVLVAVDKSYRLAIQKTVEHFTQKPLDPNEIQALKNESGFNNDWDLTEELLKRKNQPTTRDSMISVFQSFYWGKDGNGLIQNEPWLLEKNLLEKLKIRYTLSLFTGRPRKEAEFVLKKNRVDSYFYPLVAMEDVQKGKPHPEGLEQILSHLQISPSKAIYFGDTKDDMKSAKQAHILPIGLHPSYIDTQLPNLLKEEGAVRVFSSINEIENFL